MRVEDITQLLPTAPWASHLVESSLVRRFNETVKRLKGRDGWQVTPGLPTTSPVSPLAADPKQVEVEEALRRKLDLQRQKLQEIKTKFDPKEEGFIQAKADLLGLLERVETLDLNGEDIFKGMRRREKGKVVPEAVLAERRQKRLLRAVNKTQDQNPGFQLADQKKLEKITEAVAAIKEYQSRESKKQRRQRSYYLRQVQKMEGWSSYLEGNAQIQVELASLEENIGNFRFEAQKDDLYKHLLQVQEPIGGEVSKRENDPNFDRRDRLVRSLLDINQERWDKFSILQDKRVEERVKIQKLAAPRPLVESLKGFALKSPRLALAGALGVLLLGSAVVGFQSSGVAAKEAALQQSVSRENVRVMVVSRAGMGSDDVAFIENVRTESVNQAKGLKKSNEITPGSSVLSVAQPKGVDIIEERRYNVPPPAPAVTVTSKTLRLVIENTDVKQEPQPSIVVSARGDERTTPQVTPPKPPASQAVRLVITETPPVLAPEQAAPPQQTQTKAENKTQGVRPAEVPVGTKGSYTEVIVPSSKGGACEGYRSLIARYFPPRWVDTFLRIAKGESTCRSYAISPGGDYGLLQVNKIHKGMVREGNLQNLLIPEENVRVAALLFQDRGTQPWSVCTQHIVDCSPD